MKAGRSSDGRILVVEDNLVNQKVVFHQLRHLGYDADMVLNGREALDVLARASYDLVFMDCEMPEMDGYETTRVIRLCEDKTCRMRIVAMSAHTADEGRQRCLAAGMDDYIAKPFDKQTLSAVLERWLS